MHKRQPLLLSRILLLLWREPCRDAKFCVSRATNAVISAYYCVNPSVFFACETQNLASLLWFACVLMVYYCEGWMCEFNAGTLYASSVFGAAPVILFHSFPPYALLLLQKSRETTSRRQCGTGMRHDVCSGFNVEYRWRGTAVAISLSVRNTW